MKKGIIIVFGKNDLNISQDLFFKCFFNKRIRLCLVNNGSHENMLKFLSVLKSSSKCDISILNLKKEKASILAVKAGVRFLSNMEDIDLIIYAKPKNIFTKHLIDKLLNFTECIKSNKKDERVLLRKVYSIDEIINC